jgi:hypothetical protein
MHLAGKHLTRPAVYIQDFMLSGEISAPHSRLSEVLAVFVCRCFSFGAASYPRRLEFFCFPSSKQSSVIKILQMSHTQVIET